MKNSSKRGVSVTALANHFGVSRRALSNLLNSNASLSADIAIRLDKGLEAMFDEGFHTKHVDTIFRRVFGAL